MEWLDPSKETPAWLDEGQQAEILGLRSMIYEEDRSSELWRGLKTFLEAHPDAREYLAFHILNGSSGVDPKSLKGLDYPDRDIQALAQKIFDKEYSHELD
ncbi:MAG: hypothetical protein Q8P45_02505 [Candidatus Harrisonbacteria bacterium]|nr:hypothetical protein [Candidatus Harrisonbacteria bacterium]